MSDAPDNTFSAGETKLLISIIKNLNGDLVSDWDAVAVEMNYKDGTIARTRWNQTRRKKITGPTAAAARPVKTPKKPAATKKGTAAKVKPRKNAGSDSDEDEDEVEEKEIKDEEEGEDADEEEVKKPAPTPAKAKKIAAKSKVAARPKGVKRKATTAAAAAPSSEYEDDDEDEKTVKRVKRKAEVHARYATEPATDNSTGSGEDAAMGAEKDEEEIVKKEDADGVDANEV